MRSANVTKTVFARQLRKHSTQAERKLWRHLRSRSLAGFKFVRQEPIGPYIVDFICREKRLVIEVTSVEAALTAAAAGFDVIQAEKFTPPDVAALVAQTRAAGYRPVIAAAGGIHAGNVAAYAAAGADVVVTSSPYLAKPRDVQVCIGR